MPWGPFKHPPPIPDVKSDPLPRHINLGDHQLLLGKDGKWNLNGAAPAAGASNVEAEQLRARVAQLEHELAVSQRMQAQLSASSASANNSGAVVVELQHENAGLKMENEQLKYQVKVLTAIATVAEGDYLELCKEAQITPKDQPFRILKQV